MYGTNYQELHVNIDDLIDYLSRVLIGQEANG